MITQEGRINDRFSWLNRPRQQPKVENGRLQLTTDPNTDFWQGTHYEFRRDNGHCLLTSVTSDFSLTVRAEYEPQLQYDQCGLIVRADSWNWIKASTEYEVNEPSRVGSVVTNRGWSDWATRDDSSGFKIRWYRVRSRIGSNLKDFKIEYSDLIEPAEDKDWIQLRIAHLHGDFARLSVGIYACSPNPNKENNGFNAIFDNVSLEDSDLRKPDPPKANK